jgi:ABC-type multidrug transport system fused ATPase/permease subunit
LFETFRTSSLLRNRLTVLVTNQLYRLKRVDKVICFGTDGIFVGCDTFDEFTKRKVDLGNLEEEPNEDDVSSVSTVEKDTVTEQALREREQGGVMLARQASMKSLEETAEELFEAEHTRSEEMSVQIFLTYVKAAGKGITAAAALTCAMYMILPSLGSIIISQLTNAQVQCGKTKCPDQKVTMYLGWYTFTIGLSILLCIVSGISMAMVRVRSARSLHHTLLDTLSRANVAFYDSTPVGRISNRFSKDIAMIDTLLSQFFMWVCVTASIVLGAIISVAYSTKGVFLAITIPVFLAFYALFRFQRRGGANIHRIEGLTRAPVYSLFSETLSGRFTIRAFQQQDRFKEMSIKLLQRNAVPFYLGRTGLPAFLTTALNIIGLFSTGSVTLFVVFSGVVSASDAGLALSTVSAIVATLYFTVFIVGVFILGAIYNSTLTRLL